MQRRKSFFNNEMEQRFSLRKYTIGLCSVCLGFVTIGMGSQTVKADTVNNIEKSSVVQENKMQDANPVNTAVSTEAKANTPDLATAKSNITPTETKENETGSVATTAPKTNTTSNGVKANAADSATSTETKPTKATSTVANSNIVSAQAKSTKAELVVQPKVSAASTEAKLNKTDSTVVKPNVTSKEVKPNTANSATLAEIKPQETKLAKSVDAKVLAESKVATDNQFNFDDWTTQIDDTYLNITGYKGDRSKQIVVPNGADFAKAGKNDKNLQVEIDRNTLAGLIVDGVAPKLSNTDGKKIVAKGDDWSYAFSHKYTPISMDEVFFGKNTKNKINLESYPPCDERCGFILPEILGVEILYRDEDIVVVNKPSMLLSVPGRTPDKQDCLVNRIRTIFPDCIEQPSVHRLDMETSGLMVYALKEEPHRNLNKQFENKIVKKEYTALLDGVLAKADGNMAPKNNQKEGHIELKFRLDPDNRPHQIYDEEFGKLGIKKERKL